MLRICHHYYRGNSQEVQLIEQFHREYRPENAIRWYTKQSFVYKLINKALRMEDLDLLYLFRFFIGDLSDSIEREHEKILSSTERTLTVYRGAHLNSSECRKLKENLGKLISTNGYLSTTRRRSNARTFAAKATQRAEAIAVLFEIECDVQQIGKSVVYADISRLSEYSSEEEILFNLNACFRLESMQVEDGLEVIRMTVSSVGKEITRQYIEVTLQETEKMSAAIVLGKLMGDLGKYDQAQKYFEQLLNRPNGEDLAWIEHHLGRVCHLKGQWEAAREHYNHAYDLMMIDAPPRIKDSALVFNNIGLLLDQQGLYDEALEYHQRALKMKQRYSSANDMDIASSLNNIGNNLNMQAKHDDALGYHQQALAMKRKVHPVAHPSVAASLNNVGNTLEAQGKYAEALDYYQQALEMRTSYYPRGHVDIAQGLNNIGVIHFDQGEYEQALSYYQKTLKIQQQCHPAGHLEIGRTLNNLGLCYEKLGEIARALEFYRRAKSTYEKFLGTDHLYCKTLEQTIHRLSTE